MPLYLKPRKLDFSSGSEPLAVLNQHEAEAYGIQAGDRVELSWDHEKVIAAVEISSSRVNSGEIGLWREVWRGRRLRRQSVVEAELLSRPPSIEAIKKKLLGQELGYDEVYAIIADIASGRLSPVEITYYVASGFVKPNTDNELYYLSRAIAATGEQMNLPMQVVDKHSVGGLPGNRTTMLVTPIIASLGLYIPKTSSRAITSPAGTADTMEVLAPVTFPLSRIREIVKRTHACLVWGGGLNLAPADDRIIKLSRPLGLEPYDKMIVSIMAKKVAMGVDYLVIDMPVGDTAKITTRKLARQLEDKFIYLGRRLNMKVKVIKTLAKEPVGRGIGPALEARDVLRVLQQKPLKPQDLEDKAVYLAGELLELKKFCRPGEGERLARKQLQSGAAWRKMQEIIEVQGGQPNINADAVAVGAYRYEIHAPRDGRVGLIDNRAINGVCMNLGAPHEKIAGLHLHARWNQKVSRGDKLLTLYAPSKERLELGLKAQERTPVMTIS
ncbi:MAG: thymidine phosphorylase [Candidatus Kerfeldbacteria bacterium]|nr:thymidine phosphorylase [Candidatus Kerfeldbacteria bacterium]